MAALLFAFSQIPIMLGDGCFLHGVIFAVVDFLDLRHGKTRKLAKSSHHRDSLKTRKHVGFNYSSLILPTTVLLNH